MIDVLHIIDTARIGGPGKTIINSARYIDHQRFRVHVASFTHPVADRNEFARAVVDAHIPFLELPETRRVDPRHPGMLRSYIDEHHIGLVHTHGYRSDVLGWLATRRTGIAIVTTHHGWIRNTWRQKLFSYLAGRLSARFDGVQVVAPHLLDDLPAGLRHSGRAEVVQNAIVLENYQPVGARSERRRQMAVDDRHVLVGVVGRLSPEKGCLEMLDAFRELRQTRTDVSLAYIGEGPLEPELRRRISAWDLEKWVKLLPHQRDVRPIYEAIDVLACPSLTEGLSNVIMEAMAFGRPVIATRVGGNGELVVEGETGLLVEAGSPGALARGLAQITADPGRRAALGRAGQERVRVVFSFDARMRKEEAFYERALAARAQPAPAGEPSTNR